MKSKKEKQTTKVASKDNSSKLNEKIIRNILKDCIFKTDEIENGAPTKEFTYVDGVVNKFAFNTERLNKNKEKIAELIDLLPLSAIPETFLALCYDKSNRLWTGDHVNVEMIMVLGIACGLIEYAYPREQWGNLPGGVPVLIKTNKDIKEVIVGEQPEEFSKYVKKEEKPKTEKESEELVKLQDFAKDIFKTHYNTAAPVLEMLGYSMGMEGNLYYLYDSKGEKLCELSVEPFLGGFSYEGVVNDTKVGYIYSKDGVNADGSIVYRNIVCVDNIQKRDEAYYGKRVNIELGVGLHNVPDVPRIEITITEPDSDEKITKFYANPYDLSIEIENNFGPYGNYEDGTIRSVHYTNTAKTPFVNSGSLLLHESQVNGDGYNISIDRANTYPETPAKYSFSTSYFKRGNKANPEVHSYTFEGKNNANELAYNYLKTSRAKNLYNHILDHIESEINGMKEYIHQNIPSTIVIEAVMAEEPDNENEELVNSFAIVGANVPSENGVNSQKELKPNE